MTKPIRVLWSIDAFDAPPEILDREIGFLKGIAERMPIEVQPAYVLSPEQLNLSVEFSPPFAEKYVPSARRALESVFRDSGVPGLVEGKVLVHERSSLKGSVATLDRYAIAGGHDFILVGTHGRRGLSRLVFGSFAEQLLLGSHVPVVVVGRSTKVAELKSGNILFPTDFSDASFSVFGRAVEFASRMHAKILLLHAIPNPVEPVFQTGIYMLGGGWVPYPIYREEAKNKSLVIAEKWVASGTEQGVEIEVMIDPEASSVTESVLAFAARRHVGMIAMAAQSGAITNTLIGSITRQVVRHAETPVWVLHAKQKNSYARGT